MTDCSTFGPMRTTRYTTPDGQRLDYQRQCDYWRIIHHDPDLGPALADQAVGPLYRTQDELLADLPRYASASGWSDEPLPRTQPIVDTGQDRAYVRSILHRAAVHEYGHQIGMMSDLDVSASNRRIRALRDVWDALVEPDDLTSGFVIGEVDLSRKQPHQFYPDDGPCTDECVATHPDHADTRGELPRHDCGMCDGVLTFAGVEAGHNTWTCAACGWRHTSQDCCDAPARPAPAS